jgi:signal transduction histidine kinase
LTPGQAPATGRARRITHATARRAGPGLIQALAGRGPGPTWPWRSPQERRTAYAAFALATLALCFVNATSLRGVPGLHGVLPGDTAVPVVELPPSLGQKLLAVVAVAPLPLAFRYPLLAWRIGWLALLLVPLVPAAWWGGWPWGPPQLIALLAAFCLIAVRAETAPYRLSGLGDPVRAEFGALSTAAREALADMRRLLGVLRHDEHAALAPQPQLSDLPVLVEAARQAGVSVELSVARALQVPAGIGVCAYRIVQESLSNASQHAPGAAVTVSVDQDCGAVLLRVANGPGTPAGLSLTERGTGGGLTGMRERVALLGGSLSVGPAPGGGFLVSAVLPLGSTA